jgi:hypothetical protein
MSVGQSRLRTAVWRSSVVCVALQALVWVGMLWTMIEYGVPLDDTASCDFRKIQRKY